MTTKERILDSLAAFANAEIRDRYFSLYAPNVLIHGIPGIAPGLPGLRAHYETIWKAFPDCVVKPDAILECGELITVRFTFTGTQSGDFRDFPASNRRVEVPGISILRFESGQCVERWTAMDSMLLAMQIGMIPGPAGITPADS
jgi:predicted ester cyclase